MGDLLDISLKNGDLWNDLTNFKIIAKKVLHYFKIISLKIQILHEIMFKRVIKMFGITQRKHFIKQRKSIVKDKENRRSICRILKVGLCDF